MEFRASSRGPHAKKKVWPWQYWSIARERPKSTHTSDGNTQRRHSIKVTRIDIPTTQYGLKSHISWKVVNFPIREYETYTNLAIQNRIIPKPHTVVRLKKEWPPRPETLATAKTIQTYETHVTTIYDLANIKPQQSRATKTRRTYILLHNFAVLRSHFLRRRRNIYANVSTYSCLTTWLLYVLCINFYYTNTTQSSYYVPLFPWLGGRVGGAHKMHFFRGRRWNKEYINMLRFSRRPECN